MTLPQQKAILIAHRGASGYRPEHTLEAYSLAIDMGADYIEPDLVITKDGTLVARHENEISGTTDVAQKFPERKTTKTIDGNITTGFFVEDFTISEIRTLRARERLSFRDQTWNDQFEIPTFSEIIQLAKTKSRELKRTIGLYPETKHPTYFQNIGMALEEPLLKILEENGLNCFDAPVFIQSFETANLKSLSRRTGVRLIQLLESEGRPYDFTVAGNSHTYADLTTPAELAQIKSYAFGIGPDKHLILPASTNAPNAAFRPLIADAHAANLKVHVWTFRNESCFLSARHKDQPELEIRDFLALGADGLFSDFPDVTFKVRQEFAR